MTTTTTTTNERGTMTTYHNDLYARMYAAHNEVSALLDLQPADGGTVLLPEEGVAATARQVALMSEILQYLSHARQLLETPAGPYVQCRECDRVFNMGLEPDAAEWSYGHDCEER